MCVVCETGEGVFWPDFVDAVHELRSTFKSTLPGHQIYRQSPIFSSVTKKLF